MTKPARTLHSWLQYNDRGHFRRRGNNPAGCPCAVRPLIGIAQPGHPETGQRVIAHIGPIGTLSKGETIESTSPTTSAIIRARWRVINTTATAARLSNGCSRCGLLRDEIRIVAITLHQV